MFPSRAAALMSFVTEPIVWLVDIILYHWPDRPPDAKTEADDWPLLPEPTELAAHIDEHGRVELLVEGPGDVPSGPRQIPSLTACDACGRGRVSWCCANCKLRLCARHRSCSDFEREQ